MRHNKIKRTVLILIYCFTSLGLHAQAKLLEYRPKVIEVGIREFSNYKSKHEALSNNDEFLRDRLLMLRLGVPVIIKPKSLFGFQLKYYRQTYRLEEGSQSQESIYHYLDRNALINAGVNLLFQRSIDERRSLIFIGVAELASDNRMINQNTARYYISGAYNIRKHEGLELGYGLVFNYALGVLNVYPTFSYKRAINSKLSFEGLFPSSLDLRYHPSEKDFLIASIKFNNWRFNVTDALDQQPSQLTLQRADFIGSLTYEREIHDWLWFAVEASYVNNFAFIVSLPGKRINEPFQEYNLSDAGYLKLSLFIVPPKNLWQGLDR